MANKIEAGLRVDTKQATKSLKDFTKNASKEMGKLGKDMSKGNFKGVTQSVGSLGKSLAGLATPATMAAAGIAAIGVAAVATTVGVTKMAIAQAKVGDETYKASQRMNVSLGFYQKMASAAGHAGTSMTTMEAGMRTMLRTMTMVDEGSSRAIESFEKLGVEVYDSSGHFRDQEEVFKDTLVSLASMKNATERNAIAQKVLGKSANELAPLFNEGADAVNNYVNANKSAVIISDKMAKASALYQDSTQTISETFQKAKAEGLEPFVEALGSMGSDFANSGALESIAKSITWVLKVASAAATALAAISKGAAIDALEADAEVIKNNENSLQKLKDMQHQIRADLLEEARKYSKAELKLELENYSSSVAGLKRSYETKQAEIKKQQDRILQLDKEYQKEKERIYGKVITVDTSVPDAPGKTTGGKKKGGKTKPLKSGGDTYSKFVEAQQKEMQAIWEFNKKKQAMVIESANIIERIRNASIKDQFDAERAAEETSFRKEYDALKAKLDLYKVGYGALEALTSEHNATMAQIDENEAEVKKQLAIERAQEEIQRAVDITSGLQDVAASAMQYSQAKSDAELKALSKKHKKELDEFSGSAKDKKALIAKQKAEEEVIKKEAFEKNKKFQIANALISMGSGIAMAISQAMQLGPIAGPIMGAINAGIVTASSLFQVAAISKQSFAYGGVVDGFVGATSGQKDNRQANVGSGEAIMTGDQQRRLFDIANGEVEGRGGINVHIENFSGNDDDMSRLEDMLYNLQSAGRFQFA